jgi:hypothetical protein
MKFFKQTIVSVAMLLAVAVQVQAAESVSRYIGQNYTGQNTLPIRALLGLGPQHAGLEIDYVVLKASTAAGRGQATLTVNQNPVGMSQTVGRFITSYYFDLPVGSVLGENVRALQLDIAGNFYVDTLEVHFRKNIVERAINQRFRGQNTLAVRALLGIDQSYRGQRVKAVILTASTAAGQGQAQFVVNDFAVGRPQVVSTRTQEYRFTPGRLNVIGQDIQTMKIDLSGNFYVDRIAVVFEGGNGRNGGGRGDRGGRGGDRGEFPGRP